jgi:hypothetical protein
VSGTSLPRSFADKALLREVAAVEAAAAESAYSTPFLRVTGGGEHRYGDGKDGFLGAAPDAESVELGLQRAARRSPHQP